MNNLDIAIKCAGICNNQMTANVSLLITMKFKPLSLSFASNHSLKPYTNGSSTYPTMTTNLLTLYLLTTKSFENHMSKTSNPAQQHLSCTLNYGLLETNCVGCMFLKSIIIVHSLLAMPSIDLQTYTIKGCRMIYQSHLHLNQNIQLLKSDSTLMNMNYLLLTLNGTIQKMAMKIKTPHFLTVLQKSMQLKQYTLIIRLVLIVGGQNLDIHLIAL